MPYAVSHGTDIYYLTQGEGPGMLFIHGGGGNAAVWWRQAAHFGRTHQVVAYDLRGFGRSPFPAGDMTKEMFADDGLAVMDAAELDSATVVSQSRGGWSALRLALQAPERVDRLVLTCTMAGVYHAPAIESAINAAAYTGVYGYENTVLGDVFRDREPIKSYLYSQVNAYSGDLDMTAAELLYAEDTLLPLSVLETVTCPVLVIAGEHDLVWPAHTLQGIADAFPHGRLEVIAGAAHSPYFETPDAYNLVLERFIRET